MSVRILAFAGSRRDGSHNVRLLNVAIDLARVAGAEVTRLDLGALDLPLYDADQEVAEGLPDGALRFKAALRAHDALLIASPEYNGFFTPLLKNAIDWASRPEPGHPSPFAGKAAALLAASPGAFGGIRALPALRVLLSNLGVTVLPGQLALALAHEAFADDGRLRDARQQQALAGVVDGLLSWGRRVG